jgi:hypothetical protein
MMLFEMTLNCSSYEGSGVPCAGKWWGEKYGEANRSDNEMGRYGI